MSLRDVFRSRSNLHRAGLAALGLAGALLYGGPAAALPTTVVDNGFYTTDTVQGLDFLDLTPTRGMSHSQLATGYTYTDGSHWRLATAAEVLAYWSLFQTAVPTVDWSADLPISSNDSSATELRIASGTTAFAEYTGGGFFYHYTVRYSESLGWVQDAGTAGNYYIFSVRDYSLPTTWSDYWGYLTQAGSFASNGVGGWMVRDLSFNSTSVPEPGAMALLGAGLVVLGFTRRWRSR